MTAQRQDVEAFLQALISRSTGRGDGVDVNGYVDLGFARVDVGRQARQGAPEAVLATGKSSREVVAIVQELIAGGNGTALVTRASAKVRAAVRDAIPDAKEDARARMVWVAPAIPAAHGSVVMISAGTSDASVLHEARIRAELLGTTVTVHEDCGVAGLHRLLTALPDIEKADCAVVAAGMDAALVGVVGGVAPCPVIGVPTSAGYGSAHRGRTALNAMLCSCAAGVAVVGIDDGFGAGTIAATIARRVGLARDAAAPSPQGLV